MSQHKTKTGDPLTKQQSRVLDAIKRYMGQHRRSPSFRDLMAMIGATSTNAITLYLNVLEAKGRIARSTDTSRSIVLLDDPGSVETIWGRLPIGEFARGNPKMVRARRRVRCK